MPYARAYFDVPHNNQIEDIKGLLEKDDNFRKYVEASVFKPSMPASSNMLYVKGIVKPGQELGNIEKDLKELFQSLNSNWEVLSVFVKENAKGAWGYVCFRSADQCREAF